MLKVSAAEFLGAPQKERGIFGSTIYLLCIAHFLHALIRTFTLCVRGFASTTLVAGAAFYFSDRGFAPFLVSMLLVLVTWHKSQVSGVNRLHLATVFAFYSSFLLTSVMYMVLQDRLPFLRLDSLVSLCVQGTMSLADFRLFDWHAVELITCWLIASDVHRCVYSAAKGWLSLLCRNVFSGLVCSLLLSLATVDIPTGGCFPYIQPVEDVSPGGILRVLGYLIAVYYKLRSCRTVRQCRFELALSLAAFHLFASVLTPPDWSSICDVPSRLATFLAQSFSPVTIVHIFSRPTWTLPSLYVAVRARIHLCVVLFPCRHSSKYPAILA